MNASTLALCVPSEKCNKNCPYCISKMTWAPECNPKLWVQNLSKVAHLAKLAQVNDVIVTGKGEPTIQVYSLLNEVNNYFREWPLILQTNGLLLFRNECFVKDLSLEGYNIIAVSIDHPSQIEQGKNLWRWISKYGMVPRITIMLTEAAAFYSYAMWANTCRRYGIRQLSFRRVAVPALRESTIEATKTARWICDNINNSDKVRKWFEHFRDWMKVGILIRRLSYGAEIRDFGGLSVTCFDYCIQDMTEDGTIRSLIYNQDGHLYTTWNSPASLIF